MNIKWIQALAVAGGLLSMSTTAQAQQAYVSPLNAALGNGASVWCIACHSTNDSAAAGGGNVIQPMAGTWRSGANLALSDSDGDGYNNAQEVSGVSTNFNYNTVSPFTLAKAAEGSASANVVVVGGGQVTETPMTDPYGQAGITLLQGHTIAGAVSPLVTTFPATIFFNQAVNAGDKVYVVDLVNKTNTLLTSGVVFNANGSVTVSGLLGVQNIVVDRAVPSVPAPGQPRGGEEEEFGCITNQATVAMLMFLLIFLLGFFIRLKK